MHAAAVALFANAHLTPEQGLAAIDKCRTTDSVFETAMVDGWMGQLAQRFPEHHTLKIHRMQMLLENGQTDAAADLLDSRTSVSHVHCFLRVSHEGKGLIAIFSARVVRSCVIAVASSKDVDGDICSLVWNQGVAFFERQQVAPSIEWFERFIARADTPALQAKGHTAISMALFDEEKYTASLSQVERAIQLEPNARSDAWMLLVQNNMMLANFQGIRVCFCAIRLSFVLMRDPDHERRVPIT